MFEAGDGPPILFLHGAQGFAPTHPYVPLLSARHRLIAPSHPGFGQSTLPDWIDAPDDIAYIHLELLDRLDLDQVDVIGCSLGGWIACELATKSPQLVRRMVLVGPVGVKTGPVDRLDIPDIFALPQGKLETLLFHDPDAHAHGPVAPDRRTARDPAAQPRDARAADLGTVHAQSETPASAASGHRADVVRPRRQRRAGLGGVYRIRMRACCRTRAPPRSLPPDTPRTSNSRTHSRAQCWHSWKREARDESLAFQRERLSLPAAGRRIRSIRVSLPNRIYDPEKGAALYDRFLDEWLIAEDEGMEIMLNEHHQTATCVDPAAPLVLAALARLTSKARLLILGNPIANRRQPVRVAEEMAMVDILSRGRLEAGFVRGVPYEVLPANSNPVRMNERQWEALDLIVKAWTTHDGPFSHEGRFFHYRAVNIWPRPYQQPHPPIWISTTSPSGAARVGARGYVQATFLTGFDGTRAIFDAYRRGWREAGRGAEVPAHRLGLCRAGLHRAERG